MSQDRGPDQYTYDVIGVELRQGKSVAWITQGGSVVLQYLYSFLFNTQTTAHPDAAHRHRAWRVVAQCCRRRLPVCR